MSFISFSSNYRGHPCFTIDGDYEMNYEARGVKLCQMRVIKWSSLHSEETLVNYLEALRAFYTSQIHILGF